MTRTLNQLTERAGCLSGEIKAARTALNECETAETEQVRLSGIARQATERAQARLDELLAERAEIANETYNAVMAKGEPPPLADESGPPPEMIVLAPCGHASPCLYGGCAVAMPLSDESAKCELTGPNGEPVTAAGVFAYFGEQNTNGIDRAYDEATNP